MTKHALVLTTEPQITVTLAASTDCSSCTASCSKKKNIITVSNPNNFSIKKNSIVLINAGKKAQAVQGFLSLILPVLLAAAGYFLASPIASIFHRTVTDGMKALFVLGFFTISCIIIFILTRFAPLPGKPEIIEVVN